MFDDVPMVPPQQLQTIPLEEVLQYLEDDEPSTHDQQISV